METLRTLPLPVAVRRPGLDALRGWATVLVVMLHAGVPYTVAPMPGLPWPVRHTAVSPTVDGLFWGIEGFIMPLFLFLSGYGAAQSWQAKPREFLASRWRRLGWPMLAAMAVILPLELYIWLTGWALDGQIEWVKLRSLNLQAYHQDLWGLSHLWYLEYLLLYCALFWTGARWLAQRDRWRERLNVSSTSLLLLTVPVLWLWPEVIVGFQHGFFPACNKFVFSGLFFFAGITEFHRPTKPLFRPLTAGIIGVALLAGLLPLIHRQAAVPLEGSERLVLACGLAAFAILAVTTAWHVAWKSTRPTPRVVATLAQASFWIYLVHHPLVAIGQIALRPTGWPALWQFTLCTLGTLAISLASYEWLVRPTRMGAFFEGRSRQPSVGDAITPRRAA
ncbi:MAG: acyltransferase family protein [Planctomycetaceae bacterium]